MVMRRYPDGADGPSFFMKEAPTPRPSWIRICPIEHGDGKVVNFPVIDDEPSLLWCVNLGCIDLNQWYSRCDDVDRPDYLHFDLDPSEGADFALVRKAGLIVRDALTTLGMKPYVKTSGSRGLHVYVPIVRGPLQEDVLNFTKALATELAGRNGKVLTVEYRKSIRPRGRVLVDYRQNAWGQTLASIYSVRPRPKATVSVPLTWDEVEAGADIDDFRVDNVRERLDETRRPVEADPGGEGPDQPRQVLRRVNVSDFDFDLPAGQIAQEPATRGASRLLVLERGGRDHALDVRLHRRLPARGRPAGCQRHPRLSGAAHRPARAERRGGGVPADGHWTRGRGRARRRGLGRAGASRAEAEAGLARALRGRRDRARGRDPGATFPRAPAGAASGGIRQSVAQAVDAIGHVPLPPVHRPRRIGPTIGSDTRRCMRRERGSIAAPTAGLHFTDTAPVGAGVARHRARAGDAARGLRHVQAGASRDRRGAHRRSGDVRGHRRGRRRHLARASRAAPRDRRRAPRRHACWNRCRCRTPARSRRPAARPACSSTRVTAFASWTAW